jgi:hypothetical protein
LSASSTTTAAGGHTQLLLDSDLTHAYLPSTVRINANLAPASAGDSKQMRIQPEPLGSGDGSRSQQRFALRQGPLTYITAATPSGTASTLEIRVDGLLWQEAPRFTAPGADERAYTVKLDENGSATVQFGDGVHGTCLPTGSGNVEARYRVGLGTAGNVKAEQISMLLTRPPGLKAVTNPVAASGGTDAEAGDEARRNAPLRVRTLDRIVSLRDFEDFAAAFTGIGKAQAVWLWDGEQRMVHLTVAGTDGAPLDPNGALYRNLLAAIDAARPPHQPLRVSPCRDLRFGLTAGLWIAPDYESEKVLAAAGQALETAFGFGARAFGQPVTGSEVLAALQGCRRRRRRRSRPADSSRRQPHHPHFERPRWQHPGPQRPLAGQQPAAGRPSVARPRRRQSHGAHLMKLDADTLLALLPAFYRERDAELDGPLRALLGVIARQGALVEADIERLYNNAFIETCEDWVVPYIGDLLGVRALYPVSGTAAFGPRALVANTLRLRRRKGTALVLEELAFDTTGWRARAVEFFERVSTTQYMNHLRPHSLRTPDLRQPRPLDRIDGPFGSEAHTADIRALPAGRYNLPNVGLFLWRLQAYPVQRATARPARRDPVSTPSTRSASTSRCSTGRAPRPTSAIWPNRSTSRKPCTGATCTPNWKPAGRR